MTKIIISLALTIVSVSSFAGLPEMTKIYKNPKLAPKVAACNGEIYGHGFISLSKQWKDIPNSYRYKGEYDIKAYAKNGVSYDEQGRSIGLENFTLYNEQSTKLLGSLDKYIETKGHVPFPDKAGNGGYEGGLAVILYIEDKNGWAK